MKKGKTSISRQRRHQLRRRAHGLCIISGCNDPLATKNHCARHARASSQRALARYYARKERGK